MKFRKLRTDSLFRASPVGNIDNINYTKSFNGMKSNVSGWYNAQRTPVVLAEIPKAFWDLVTLFQRVSMALSKK